MRETLTSTELDEPRFSSETLLAVTEALADSFPIPNTPSQLVLMDVDPQHLHAYWHLSASDPDLASSGWLRLHGGATVQEQPVTPDVNRCYWTLQSAGDYRAELGIRAADGGFVSRLTSNPVHLPASAFSVPYAVPPALVVPEIPAPVSPPPEPVTETHSVTPLPVDSEPALAETGLLIPEFPYLLNTTPPASALLWPTELAQPSVPPLTDHAVLPTVWIVQDESPAAPPQLLHTLTPPLPQLAQLVTPPREPLLHAVPTAATASLPPVIPLEQWLGSSSSQLGQHNPLVNLQAELHLYGTAQPGSLLSLSGQQVPLRPDGSFSLHLTLPVGALGLAWLLRDGSLLDA